MINKDVIPVIETAIPSEKSSNLLDIPWFNRFMRSRWFPGIIQWPTAAVFVLIMYQLVLGPASAHDNFGTALTWVLWWPLIPIIFLFLGRFWCAICPFATFSDLVQKLVGNNRPVPKFLKKYGIWIIDAMFILITWGDHVFGVVESPAGSGVLMLGLTTGVVASGAFWERRTWCRYLCFLGGLSANYAQAGILSLRGTPSICKTCTVAACYKGSEKAPGCPLFEFPKTMTSNANCVVCGYCIKSCPNDSIQMKLRLPTQELWFIHKPKLEVAFLAVIIMGIVFVQNVTMLEIWGTLQSGLERLTGTDSYAVSFTIAFLIAMAIPVLLLAGAALAGKKINGESLAQNFAKFGYAIIPLDMAGHIGHNLFHLLAEGKAVAFTGLALFGKEVYGASPALMSSSSIQLLQYLLVLLGGAASLYAAFRISKNYYGEKGWASFAPYAVLILFLIIVNIALFMLPMGMRM